MRVPFLCDDREIVLTVPEHAVVYASSFPEPVGGAAELALAAMERPFGAPSLRDCLTRRAPGPVVVVVSDITRPVPYRELLPPLLGTIEAAGVSRGDILILVATGMHRPSTPAETQAMFGPDVVAGYRILDHRADRDADLCALSELSWAGRRVRLNRHYVEAGFRIVTGLVEPHFMAGFSGGRKAVCPGLASLDAIQAFHGHEFLSSPLAANSVLAGNPCHEEALSVARAAGVDFSLNVVLDRDRRVVKAFGGEVVAGHEEACRFVRKYACVEVAEEADVAATSSGGYPLDATFYQCVKGFVSCLPAVKREGAILAFGGCREGVGSEEYERLMVTYSGRWEQFLEDIRQPGVFVKDQWELQMQARALAHVGERNLKFVTDGLDAARLARLSVNGVHASEEEICGKAQAALDGLAAGGKSLAVFPEGPYCVPVGRTGADGLLAG